MFDILQKAWPLQALGLGLALACAQSTGPLGAPSAPAPAAGVRVTSAQPLNLPAFPAYDGRTRKVQVVQINIPMADLERYPELADKQVGFGVSNLLVETLFDTGRFRFVEEKADILRRLVEQWELTSDGILVSDPAASGGSLQAPEFLVYAEIFDFVACSPIERVGAGKQVSCVTSVGVQVRINNAATGEYIPGSTNPGDPAEKVVHTSNLSLFSDGRKTFDQSAVGLATQKGLHYAVLKALKRFDRAGW